MGDLTNLGKKAEKKVKEWLDRPQQGCYFLRLPDQLSGFSGSANTCDFIMYRTPKFYLIESKATLNDNFPYTMITDYQYTHMLEAAQVAGVTSYIIVLFASYQRAFLLDIKDIAEEKEAGRKSLNITKVDKWKIPYIEVKTLKSRKELLDYDPSQIEALF